MGGKSKVFVNYISIDVPRFWGIGIIICCLFIFFIGVIFKCVKPKLFYSSHNLLLLLLTVVVCYFSPFPLLDSWLVGSLTFVVFLLKAKQSKEKKKELCTIRFDKTQRSKIQFQFKLTQIYIYYTHYIRYNNLQTNLSYVFFFDFSV